MPYMIFKVFPNRTAEYIDQREKFIEAKREVTELRKALPEGAEYTVRLVLAKDQFEGERLLTEPREAPILGETIEG